VDVGAGDGRYALAAAGADSLAIAVDAHGPAMASAWRRVQRQRLDNVLLVVAQAEALPPELDGLADAVTVHFPWGSLLRGVLEVEAPVASGLARVAKPGADVTAVLSVTDRERALGLPLPDERLEPVLAERYAAHGLTLVEWRPATRQEIEATRSSWARRLGAGERRPAWRMRLVRDHTVPE
jgi:16S rRNA (adenine(1408)-N(1))-methyltransferase